MLTKLPRKHLYFGAAALFAFGLFLAAMTYFGTEFVNRPYIDQPYAIAVFTEGLVGLFGRLGAAIVNVVLFGAGALVLLRAARNAQD